MATALSLITASLGDCGVIGIGESIEAAIAQDCFRRLNNMVSGWRTQYGTVTSIDRLVFPLTTNQQTYTIGLGGDFNVPRPLTVNAAALWLNALADAASITSITRVGLVATVTLTAHGLAVGSETLIAGATQLAYNGLQTVASVPTADTFTFTVTGSPVTPATGTLTSRSVSGTPVEIPRPVITDDAYQAMQLKNLSDAQFTTVYYNATSPLGTISLWPLPDTDENQLVLYLQNAFTGFADLTTDYDFPDNPGYSEALQYQFDKRLILPYAVKDPAVLDTIERMSSQTFGLIKRANNKLADLPTDAQILTSDFRGGYNINAGTGG